MGQDRRCPASLKFLEKFLKKMKFIVDKSEKVRYTKRVRCERYKNKTHRCVAQLGRALRSGRRGRKFESCRLDLQILRPVGQAVKTTPSHGVNPGSIPGQVICCCILQQHFLKVLPWLSW